MSANGGGARERGRARRREALTRAAMRLFTERGFDAATVDDIAAAAGVSRRTFFHYFASKDDVVLAWQDTIDAALVAAAAARPPGEGPMRAAEEAVLSVVEGFEHAEAAALARLVEGAPALRAAEHAKYERMEGALARVLEARGGDGDPLAPRLAAMAAVGVLRVATRAWLAEGGAEPPAPYARRVFRALHATLRTDGA